GARLQPADRDGRDHEHPPPGAGPGHPGGRHLGNAAAGIRHLPGLAARPADRAPERPRLSRRGMSRGAPAVTAAALAAGYRGRPVWSGADLTIPAGSFTAVLGPNGSGKSTLVRLILGLLPPLAGRLEVLGRPPRRGNPEIGYVAQGAGFDPEFSIRGRDFVGLGIDGHRWGLPLGSHTA